MGQAHAFDFTGGWGRRHTVDEPVVVVTHHVPMDCLHAHPDAPFHLVTDGMEAAVAKAQANAWGRMVAGTASDIGGLCLELGPLDAVAIDLVPVGDPTVCIQSERVTRLLPAVTKLGSER